MPHFLDNLDDNRPFDLTEAHAAVQLLIQQVTERSRTRDSGMPQIVGQKKLVRRLVSAFLTGEHCLLEGLPGLVKTEVSKTLAAMLGLVFQRIQFTPDMMPSDLISRDRLELVGGQPKIVWEPGPIFTNILLADEINRASSKVQSALLEATEERQVSGLGWVKRIRPCGDVQEEKILDGPGCFSKTHEKLPAERLQHFMVLATMNPIELEGVFPLSEAQVDRFAYKLVIDYPPAGDLTKISEHAFEHPRMKMGKHDPEEHKKTLYFLSMLRKKLLGESAQELWMNTRADLRWKCETLVNFTHLGRPSRRGDDELGEAAAIPTLKQEELLAQLSAWQSGTPAERARAQWILDWRTSESYPDVHSGSSPRGLLKLIRAIHAEAFLRGAFQNEVPNPSWEDVTEVAPDILRHRVRLSSAPSLAGASTTQFILGLAEWLAK